MSKILLKEGRKYETTEGTEGGRKIFNNPLIFNLFSVFSVVKF